jgi:uncharacterized iron-regulated membrane protein
MNLRRVLLFLHLTGGLVAAVFLLLLGGSGALLVFENEIDHWLNARLTWVQPEGPRLSLSEMAGRVLQRHPGSKVTSFRLPTDERIALTIGLHPAGPGKPTDIRVNPYTGGELGSMDTANTFTGKLHQFHTNLLLGKDGKFITAMGALFLFLLSVSGLILWWPRRLWRFGGPKPAGSAAFQLHNVAGFHASVFMLIFAVTGTVIYWDDEVQQWINKAIHAKPAPPPGGIMPPHGAAPLDPDALLAAANKAVPGASTTSIQGLGGIGPVRITMKYPEDRTPAGRTNLFLDPYTAETLSLQTSRSAPLGTRIAKLWNREIHTGDIFAWPTRILACIASATLPLLAITGPLIWLGRVRRNRHQANSPAMPRA